MNPCANGGTCWTSEESFYCACRAGMLKELCQRDLFSKTVRDFWRKNEQFSIGSTLLLMLYFCTIFFFGYKIAAMIYLEISLQYTHIQVLPAKCAKVSKKRLIKFSISVTHKSHMRPLVLYAITTSNTVAIVNWIYIKYYNFVCVLLLLFSGSNSIWNCSHIHI